MREKEPQPAEEGLALGILGGVFEPLDAHDVLRPRAQIGARGPALTDDERAADRAMLGAIRSGRWVWEEE